MALLLAIGCGGDPGDSDDESGDDTAVDTTGEPAATEPAPTSSTSDDTGPADTTGDSEGVDVGPNFGLLTFTFYPADASKSPAQLGMAGAWRTEPFTTDDFFAVRMLGSFFPLVPDTTDVPLHSGPGVYDWGFKDSWVGLGNGMRLGPAVACLEVYKDKFPVYLSDDAANLDPACAPDPSAWQPGTAYDLSVYGGEAFADQTLAGAVTTPTAITVTAPDVAAYNFPLDHTVDLELAWTADGGADDRVVVRMWDQFGEMITVRADDDGSAAIPAADLASLSLGAATLTVAREHTTELGLGPGTLRVVARHEVWAYPDLF